jgi:hypothetical protein
MSKVEVRSSSTHGNGVFATLPIKRGDLITRYPDDLYIIDKNGLTEISSPLSNGYLKSILSRMTMDQIRDYRWDLMDNVGIFGDPEKYTPEACTHLINDAVYIDKINRYPLEDEVGKEHVNFMIRSKPRHNCCLHTCTIGGKNVCWAIARRDISADEELFTSYGYPYWTPNIEADKMLLLIEKHCASLSDNQRSLIKKLATSLSL